jgi:hypothetical protein
MKKIKLECCTCKCSFEKPINEYNRRIKMGKTLFYCSLSCGAKSEKNLKMIQTSGLPYHFKGGENKLVTEDQKILSSMKEFAKRVRYRKKKFVDDLDIYDMMDIWKAQNGKCKFTNVDLILPYKTEYKTTSNNYKASIDRIDSSKPYLIENIQFVSLTVNTMKGNMADSEVYDFFNIVNNNL